MRYDQPYSVYNYIDKPDFDMHDLVAGFENALGKKMPPFSLPYWLGLVFLFLDSQRNERLRLWF